MGDDFLLGVEPPLPQVQGSPVRLASASSSPSVKMKVWKEKRPLYRQPRVPAPAARRRGPATPPQEPPLPTPLRPPVHRAGQGPNLSGSRAGASADLTPPCRQLGPRSPGSCAGTSQVGRPAHPPGNRLQARPAHLAGHTPLLTQPGGGGRGR